MKYHTTLLSGLAALSVFALAWSAMGRSDYYTSGFYTRGTDAAFYMDQGGAVIDPFYIPVQSWSLLPRITLTATREDNLYMDSENPEKAETLSLIPGLLFMYGRPEQNHLYADYGIVIPLYDSADDLNDEPSHMLVLGGQRQTGKSQIYGRAGYRRLEHVDTMVGARILKEDYIGDLGLEYRISTKSSLGAIGSYERHEFDDDAYYGYVRYYGAGRLYHRVTAKSEVFLQAGWGRDDVDAEPSDFGDSEFFDVSLGLRGKQSQKLSLGGRVGYQWRDFTDDDISDVEHWIASLEASSSPFGVSIFSAELYADVRPTINDPGSVSVDQRATLSVNRRLFSERLRGQASIYAGQTDYDSPRSRPENARAEDPLVFDGRNDEYWGYSFGLDWYTKQNLSIGIDYSYVDNSGIEDGNSEQKRQTTYDAGRWTLRLSWNY